MSSFLAIDQDYKCLYDPKVKLLIQSPLAYNVFDYNIIKVLIKINV